MHHGMQRDATGLDALVAAFSTGPVGLGDGPGYTDAALALATCRADETLLQVRACSVMQCSLVQSSPVPVHCRRTSFCRQAGTHASISARARACHAHACMRHAQSSMHDVRTTRRQACTCARTPVRVRVRVQCACILEYMHTACTLHAHCMHTSSRTSRSPRLTRPSGGALARLAGCWVHTRRSAVTLLPATIAPRSLPAQP